MPFADEHQIVEGIAVKTQAIDADVILPFGNVEDGELIIGGMINAFYNAGAGTVKAIEYYQYTVNLRVFNVPWV